MLAVSSNLFFPSRGNGAGPADSSLGGHTFFDASSHVNSVVQCITFLRDCNAHSYGKQMPSAHFSSSIWDPPSCPGTAPKITSSHPQMALEKSPPCV